MGGPSLRDLTAASVYGDVCDTESRLCLGLGRNDEAEKLARTVGDIAEKVLARRPGDLRAMKDRYQSPDVLGRVARATDDNVADEAFQRKALEAAKIYTTFDPADSDGWLACSISSNEIAGSLMSQGRVSDALQQWHATTEIDSDSHNISGSGGYIYYAWRYIATYEAQLGHIEAAEYALAELHRYAEKFRTTQGMDQAFSEVSAVWESLYRLDILAAKGDYEAIHSQAIALDERLQKIVPKNSLSRNIRTEAIRQTHTWIAEAALRTGRSEEALSASKGLVDRPYVNATDEKILVDMAVERAKTRLGQALIVSGQKIEARVPLGEALAYYRSRQANGASETKFRQDFGNALFEMAQAQDDDGAGRSQRSALLDEAQSVLGGLSQEAQQLRTSKELIEWVSQARSKAGA
jgi:hypothetical protein